MKTATVRVPAALLLDRRLLSSAKLLWMIGQLNPQSNIGSISPTNLESWSGLARHTVLRGLALLETSGYRLIHSGPKLAPHVCRLPEPGSWASLPSDLLLDRIVGLQAKVLYATLQLTETFQGTAGQFTYPDLGRLVGISPRTLKLAVEALRERGWLATTQQNKYSPIRFVLRNPAADQRDCEVAEADFRLGQAKFRGEALMREFLSLIVDSNEFEDNASPEFLVNPYTGELLQYDRYYPPHVAFEYNGPQHYGRTPRYSNEAKIGRQRARDYIKLGISMTSGVRLVVIQAEELTLECLRHKAAELLPLRELDGHEPLIAFLQKASRRYRRKARQGFSESAERAGAGDALKGN